MQNDDLIPGLGRSPGEGNDDHSSILAWKIPWTEELVGCRPWGHKESGKTEHTCMHTCSLYTHFVESFDHNWVSNFVKSSFCIYWGDYMVFVLQFITVVYCILICGYWTILDIASLDKSFLIERYVLLMYCWNQFADTSLRIFVFISDTGM